MDSSISSVSHAGEMGLFSPLAGEELMDRNQIEQFFKELANTELFSPLAGEELMDADSSGNWRLSVENSSLFSTRWRGTNGRLLLQALTPTR